jgi:hypothetical protein
VKRVPNIPGSGRRRARVQAQSASSSTPQNERLIGRSGHRARSTPSTILASACKAATIAAINDCRVEEDELAPVGGPVDDDAAIGMAGKDDIAQISWSSGLATSAICVPSSS